MNLAFFLSGGGGIFSALCDARRAGLLGDTTFTVLMDKDSALENLLVAERIKYCVVRRETPLNRDLFRAKIEEAAMNLDVDFSFLHFNWLLPKQVVKKFENRMINLHMALLPLFKGRHAIRQALESGMKLAGVTFHYVNEEMDSGKIVAQAAVPIAADETERTLGFKLFSAAVPLQLQLVRSVLGGELIPSKKNIGEVVSPSSGVLSSLPLDQDIVDFSREWLRKMSPR